MISPCTSLVRWLQAAAPAGSSFPKLSQTEIWSQKILSRFFHCDQLRVSLNGNVDGKDFASLNYALIAALREAATIEV